MSGVLEELRELGLDEETLRLIEGEVGQDEQQQQQQAMEPEGQGQHPEATEGEERDEILELIEKPAVAEEPSEEEVEEGGQGERAGVATSAEGAAQGAQESPGGMERLLEILRRMSPQERAEWAAKEGPPAIMALMELQKLELKEEMQRAVEQQREEVLKSIIEEWAAEHQDIIGDPMLATIAEGIDMALLRRAGYSSYKELTPAQLRRHLDQVGKIVSKLRERGLGALSEANENQKKGGDARGGKGEGVVHVGDLTGGGGKADGTLVSPEAILEADPLVLEEKIGNLSEEELSKLLMSLENQVRR